MPAYTRVFPVPPRGVSAASPRRRWPLVAFGVFVLAMVVLSRVVDVGRYVEASRAWTDSLGVLAPAAYVVVYVAATLVGAPGLPFTLAAPLLFGVLPAFLVMVVASALSAAVAFLVARHLARDAVVEWLAGTDGFARLTALVEKHHWIVIPLLRIVPLAPFAVLNYGLGLTGIGFWRYLLWSELAMIPMNAVLVLGSDLFFYHALARGTAS